MVLGITGGVGSGKSAAVSILQKQHHAKILIADEIGHDAMKKGSPVYERVAACFGGGVQGADGGIDRAKLAEVVYHDKEKLALLNSMVHPFVIREIEKKLSEWKDSPLIVLETAILFETGCGRLCDEVWGVLAGREIRLERLMNARGYTAEQAEGIMCQQMCDEELAKRCTRILDNNGSMEKLEENIGKLLKAVEKC